MDNRRTKCIREWRQAVYNALGPKAELSNHIAAAIVIAASAEYACDRVIYDEAIPGRDT